jgi:hypothetical protein
MSSVTVPEVQPPQERTSSDPRVNSYVLFFSAFAILAFVLTFGALYELLQYNIFYLMAASLAVAVLLAFIPLAAQLEVSGLIRAGGAAAIFALCFWVTKPFAEEYSKVQFERMRIENARAQKALETAEAELGATQTQLGSMQAQLSAVVADNRTKAAENELAQAQLFRTRLQFSKLLNEQLPEIQQTLVAAQSAVNEGRILEANQQFARVSALLVQVNETLSPSNKK